MMEKSETMTGLHFVLKNCHVEHMSDSMSAQTAVIQHSVYKDTTLMKACISNEGKGFLINSDRFKSFLSHLKVDTI